MMYPRTTSATRMISSILLSGLCACSPAKSEGQAEKKPDKQSAPAKQEKRADQRTAQRGPKAGIAHFAAAGCDASLWKHVYDPPRLKKRGACIAVTGVVVESAADDDGDQHFLLQLDPGQEALVNKANQKQKNGALVIEIVCANPISLPKAKAACAGFRNGIAVAPVGAHVRATGSYVIDSHNGWAEIHPVSKLQRM